MTREIRSSHKEALQATWQWGEYKIFYREGGEKSATITEHMMDPGAIEVNKFPALKLLIDQGSKIVER